MLQEGGRPGEGAGSGKRRFLSGGEATLPLCASAAGAEIRGGVPQARRADVNRAEGSVRPVGLEVVGGVGLLIKLCVIVVEQQFGGLAQLLLVPVHGVVIQVLKTIQGHGFSHPGDLVFWVLGDHGTQVTCRERWKMRNRVKKDIDVAAIKDRSR